jgi:lysophospholipase L1-like esterase
VPNKESIYPEMLTRRARRMGTVMCPQTRRLLEQLNASGVEVVDLFEAFQDAKRAQSESSGQLLYLAQDSHWSPVGVELAAQAVAQRILERGWIEPGTLPYDENPVRLLRLGDVVEMLQSPQIERRVGPNEIVCTQVVRRDTGAVYEDEPDSAILILGDSCLRIYERDEPGAAGFVAHLARELKQPLTSIVNDGGASTLVRQQLYGRPELLVNKKVVIWEFVERDIAFGTEGWQLVLLPPVTSVEE